MMHLVYARIADLIKASGTDCFIGDPPENVPVPYCFVWGPLPTDEALTAAGTDAVVDEIVNVTVVAKAPPDVLVLAAEVKNTLTGAEPQIAGWRTFPLKIVGSTDIRTERGVVNDPTNTYPAWVTLHVRVQATKERAT